MRIVVDKLPDKPRDCLFSKRNVKYGYVCQLRPFIPDANGKPPCLCNDCSNCECLVELKERQG